MRIISCRGLSSSIIGKTLKLIARLTFFCFCSEREMLEFFNVSGGDTYCGIYYIFISLSELLA